MPSVFRYMPSLLITNLVVGHGLMAGLASRLAWIPLTREPGWSVEASQWALILGIPFGQATLLGCWTAMGSGRWAVRAMLSLLALLVVWAAVFVIRPLGRHRFDSEILLPLLALLGQAVVVLLLLSFLRRWHGWNWPAKEASGTNELGRPWQFGIRHLMVWTTATALLLTLGRLLAPYFAIDRELYDFMLFGVANCAFSTPLLALAMRERGVLVGVLLSVLWLIVVTLGEIQLFTALEPRSSIHERIWLVNGVQFAVIVDTMWPVRVALRRRAARCAQSP